MTRVLVVEDELQLVRALEINLKARKYEVDAASDGGTALRLAAARPRTSYCWIWACPTWTVST